MNKIELISKLKRIDEDIFFSGEIEKGKRASIIIVGSGALLLRDLSAKDVTKDVDVLRIEQQIRPYVYADLDFNSQCLAYESCLPYNFEERLVPIMLDTFVLDVFVPSMEDIAVMKLYRWEDPDRADLTSDDFLNQLDWEKLDSLVHSPDEAAASRSALPEQDREYKNLQHNYAEYERKWRS